MRWGARNTGGHYGGAGGVRAEGWILALRRAFFGVLIIVASSAAFFVVCDAGFDFGFLAVFGGIVVAVGLHGVGAHLLVDDVAGVVVRVLVAVGVAHAAH